MIRLLPILLLIGCSHPQYTHGVPHLIQVSGHSRLWRGGQPQNPEGWKYLHDVLGIRTVVKLDYESEGSDKPAEALGMKVIRVSMPPSDGDDLFKGPSAQEIDAALGALNACINDDNGGCYGHCLHGNDRTGMMFALVRVYIDHWPVIVAKREMAALGYHVGLFGLDESLYDYLHSHPHPEPPSQ
jgi:protein tyrosine/serine phosphatase